MSRRLSLFFLLLALTALVPFRSPAPLYYNKGEGWYYEPHGETNHWMRMTAREQLEVARDSYTNGHYNLALHAARRVVRLWPASDYSPEAEYLAARCLEATHRDELAFKTYEVIIQRYPNSEHFTNVLWRQYDIANRFLGGEWTKALGYIPFPASMDETARYFSIIVTNGPYSEVAPHAQMQIGAAREKQKSYDEAVKAYQVAADRYYNHPDIASDALFHEGLAYQKQAATAEYDQGTAGKSIAAYTDFMALYPDDPRVPDAEKAIATLKSEQVLGNFKIAQFYERYKKWAGAVVYYNEVLQLDPNSPYAEPARQRIEELKPRLRQTLD
jgi:outer membrane protein assembly factor BamD